MFGLSEFGLQNPEQVEYPCSEKFLSPICLSFGKHYQQYFHSYRHLNHWLNLLSIFMKMEIKQNTSKDLFH